MRPADGTFAQAMRSSAGQMIVPDSNGFRKRVEDPELELRGSRPTAESPVRPSDLYVAAGS
jgi:hypothetical protein